MPLIGRSIPEGTFQAYHEHNIHALRQSDAVSRTMVGLGVLSRRCLHFESPRELAELGGLAMRIAVLDRSRKRSMLPTVGSVPSK